MKRKQRKKKSKERISSNENSVIGEKLRLSTNAAPEPVGTKHCREANTDAMPLASAAHARALRSLPLWWARGQPTARPKRLNVIVAIKKMKRTLAQGIMGDGYLLRQNRQERKGHRVYFP